MELAVHAPSAFPQQFIFCYLPKFLIISGVQIPPRNFFYFPFLRIWGEVA